MVITIGFMLNLNTIMKHLFALLLALSVPLGLLGQKNNELGRGDDISFLKGVNNINLELDLSSAPEEVISYQDSYKELICKEFNNILQARNIPLRMNTNEEAEYTMTIKYSEVRKESKEDLKKRGLLEKKMVDLWTDIIVEDDKGALVYFTELAGKTELKASAPIQTEIALKNIGNQIGALVVQSIYVPFKDINNPAALSLLKDENKVNIVIDYSAADILGVDFEDWVESADDWDNYTKEHRTKFIQAFNKEAERIRVGSYPDMRYTLQVHILKVDDKGTEINALISVVDSEEGVIIFEKEMDSEDGLWGTVANLMGDSLADLGKKVGRLFYLNAK